ncbi:ATPase [Shewanella algicola]|uniref:C4-dicarboxylate transport sensor protein DctB n=1 Tax=Shewanella algicola TaxID=640633 RepID=A0A9X2CBY5_9GAMM|nr:ATP-binding protein [Shewanella algicola]MCL1107244.1 ATP-binding protein [Shewanella algicola]GGP66625.1 ATPase [Shewanella algicola]
MFSFSTIKKRKIVVSVMVIIGLLLTLKVTHWYWLEQGTESIAYQSEKQINELVIFIDDALGHYENIPAVLAQNPIFEQSLLDQQNPQAIKKLNQYLSELQQVTESSDIYLTDAMGVAIAASNWDKSNSFINQDYSFRPYFIEAISGRSGRYYAVGTSSNKRGFYFANPVYHKGVVFGVIVVKVDISLIEQQSSGIAIASQYEFMISDPDNIVFLSSMNGWRFNSLTPLSQSKRFALNASKRYANRPIGELDFVPQFASTGSNKPQVYRISSIDGQEQYLEHHQNMPNANWNVHILAPMTPLYESLPPILLLAATLYSLLALFVLYSLERRRNFIRMRQAQNQLEQRVKERTLELEQANNQLKDTQDELIQAAKLTVIGSLSASINHELNQPLAALRSYAQNTQTFIGRNMIEDARSNINIMIELTDRLADIIAQFKSFTRKSQGKDNATDINQSIEQALTIVQPEMDKQGVKLSLALLKGSCQIWGDSVRLQQVLVNLMSNAIVAMQQSKDRRLHIEVYCDTKVNISIQDSGPGVRQSQMSKIFEPYYTTSERQGLGLGLSISQRIIESMQGSITVENAQQGGAIFHIILPLYLREEV